MYERVQLLLKTLHDSPSVNTKEHIYSSKCQYLLSQMEHCSCCYCLEELH